MARMSDFGSSLREHIRRLAPDTTFTSKQLAVEFGVAGNKVSAILSDLHKKDKIVPVSRNSDGITWAKHSRRRPAAQKTQDPGPLFRHDPAVETMAASLAPLQSPAAVVGAQELIRAVLAVLVRMGATPEDLLAAAVQAEGRQ